MFFGHGLGMTPAVFVGLIQIKINTKTHLLLFHLFQVLRLFVRVDLFTRNVSTLLVFCHFFLSSKYL